MILRLIVTEYLMIHRLLSLYRPESWLRMLLLLLPLPDYLLSSL
jgi:hypothetical protein